MTTKQEVARAAIKLEQDGRTFYLDAAANTASDLVRKMFESLADDERDHIEWIKQTEPGASEAATVNRQLYERLRHIFADVPEATLRTLAKSKSDVDAINFAIDIEQKSIDAYEGWAKNADKPEVRALCDLLAGTERFHRQVLENTLEYFEHTPDWFMKEEQWNFEGA